MMSSAPTTSSVNAFDSARRRLIRFAAAGTGRPSVWRQIRMLEFVIGLTLAFWRYPITTGLPGEIVVLAIAVLIGLCIRARVQSPNLVWITLLYVAVVGSAVVVSIAGDEPWQQRTVRLLLLFAFAWVIAAGRLHWPSLVAGAVVSLVVNTAAYYLGLTPDYYAPYLTGWLGDKNVAGFFYAVIALLGLSLIRLGWVRLLFALSAFGALWLTGSRTSLAAFVAGVLWWLLRNRLPLVLRLLSFAAGAVLLVWFESEFSRFGPFADREGTDLLRGTIHAAEAVKIAETPWYGSGFNSAWVDIQNFPHMWFHDSYAGLFVEGGYPMLWGMLLLVAITGLGLFSVRRPISEGLRAAEGALVVVLVCAWQLGEVFFTSATFLALGVAWYERFAAQPPLDSDAKPNMR